MFLSLPFFESIGFGGLIIFLAVLYLILYLVLKSPVKSPEDATCANDELAGDNETSIDIIAKNVYFTVMTIMNEIIAVIIGAMLTSPLGFLTPWGFSAGGILSGAFVGWRHASKSKYLPRNALFRYLPLLAPILAVLAVAAYQNFRADNASYQHYALWVAAVSFPCVSFLVFFIISGASNKKTPSTGNRFLLPPFAAIALLAAVFTLQSVSYHKVTFTEGYQGPTVTDYVDLGRYQPSNENNELASLGETASFRVIDNFPAIDGATAFFPMYAAILNETYGLTDKAKFENYLFCTRTPEAYNRLIRGEVDAIFALQPSEGQLEMARASGVKMSFTPIARDAFVFFVNKDNPVSSLTIKQIQDIYTKNITNWKKLGGDNKSILPFQRPDDSGSQTAMLKEVMREKPLPPPLKDEYHAGMGGMVLGVAAYRDYAESIGYSFRFFTKNMVRFDFRYYTSRGKMAYKRSDERVKLLAIDGVSPTEENIGNGTYPLTVEIYAVTAGTTNPNVRGLIDWVLSPQGQNLIEKTGYVGIK
jgi:phosphate transport system substrate-binding protein